MKLYDVYTKTSSSGSIHELVIVKNGFSFLALIFNVLWFLYKKMWRIFLIIFAINFVLFGITSYAIMTPFNSSMLSLAMLLIIAGNAHFWYGKYLQNHGYDFSGAILARNEDLARLRFLEEYAKNYPDLKELFSDFMSKKQR